ncbi:MAG: hypothetical protein BalsKO_20720 [Balneolaceae bacterium]
MVNCETGDPLIKPIQTGIDSKNYQAALIAADSAIIKEPTNPIGYYYKGYVLSEIAKAEPVITDRKSIYGEMYSALSEASRLYSLQETKGSEAGKIEPLILQSWSIEHNAAIPYATNDSVKATVDNPLDLSIAHLVNATTVNPDSTLSYDVLAQVYYMNSEFDNAATALTKVIELEGTGLPSEYDRLGSYYFLSEQPEKAVSSLEEGLELYPDSTALIQKLADGLFQIDRTDDALKIMDRLVEAEPDNARYHLVIGTRVYQRVLTLSDSYTENSDRIYDLERNDGSEEEINMLKSDNEALEVDINQLTDRAEKELLMASELDPTISSTFNTLGILYQNKSASLFDKRNNTVDNDEAARLDDMARDEATKAMTFYEKATELDPDNTSYWGSLFRIYTLLDMREKAEAAMEKAGM